MEPLNPAEESIAEPEVVQSEVVTSRADHGLAWVDRPTTGWTIEPHPSRALAPPRLAALPAAGETTSFTEYALAAAQPSPFVSLRDYAAPAVVDPLLSFEPGGTPVDAPTVALVEADGSGVAASHLLTPAAQRAQETVLETGSSRLVGPSAFESTAAPAAHTLVDSNGSGTGVQPNEVAPTSPPPSAIRPEWESPLTPAHSEASGLAHPQDEEPASVQSLAVSADRASLPDVFGTRQRDDHGASPSWWAPSTEPSVEVGQGLELSSPTPGWVGSSTFGVPSEADATWVPAPPVGSPDMARGVWPTDAAERGAHAPEWVAGTQSGRDTDPETGARRTLSSVVLGVLVIVAVGAAAWFFLVGRGATADPNPPPLPPPAVSVPPEGVTPSNEVPEVTPPTAVTPPTPAISETEVAPGTDAPFETEPEIVELEELGTVAVV